MISRLRYVAGLIMFSYLISHFTNHMLGLVSLDAMEAALRPLYRFWSYPLVSWALYGAFGVHFALALWALWQRRTLRMPIVMALQYVLGFTVPLLAIEHVTMTRVAKSFFDVDTAYYSNVIVALWHAHPFNGVLQGLLLVVAWTHACIGLRYRLRLKPWYDRAQPLLYAFVLLVPVLALLGYAQAGREVLERIARDPGFLPGVLIDQPAPGVLAELADVAAWGRWLLFGSIAGVLLARQLRHWWQARHGRVRIGYPNSASVAVIRGTSILEASRLARIPHASICGGRGRCSTCRVRVRGNPASIPPPANDELTVLRRVGAPDNVRLACQLRPRGDIEVVPLLPPLLHPREGFRRSGHVLGTEQEIAVLFADLRAFTRFAESKLPFDVVFILNRYFAAMGGAIEQAGGRVDKFIGDGIMALFGIEEGPQAGCRHALEAARLMSLRLHDINREFEQELAAPLRIGIGIHVGPVIVGEMGYGRATQLTAIGDVVNTASRLEALSKDLACELVISEDVAARAGVDMAAFELHAVEIRGREQPVRVRAVRQGSMIAVASDVAVAGAQ